MIILKNGQCIYSFEILRNMQFDQNIEQMLEIQFFPVVFLKNECKVN